MLDKLIASEVLEKALSSGGTFAEIFFEDTLTNSLVMRNDTVETVSSGRSPAANNGLVAYTPSRGVISLRGNWPLHATKDVVVPHSRSVDDLLAIVAARLTEAHRRELDAR